MITCMRVLNAAAKSAVIPCCAVVLVAACAKHPGVAVDGRGNKLPGARTTAPPAGPCSPNTHRQQPLQHRAPEAFHPASTRNNRRLTPLKCCAVKLLQRPQSQDA